MSDSRDNPGFLAELRRRRVVRVGIGYAAAMFVVLQAGDLIFEALAIGDGVFRVLVIVALAGLPVALVLGWLFDVTPEGLRRTARHGEAGRLLARIPPWAIFAPITLLLVSAVAFAVAVNVPRAAGGAVKPGAEVIAVVPFTVTGGGTGMTGEGFVDLLSRNLDQVGGIRTVEPRTVLYRWEQRDEDARAAAQDAALEIGRDVRAGSVLTGSVVVLGSEVRISADVFPVDGTEPLASAQVEGSSDRLLELVDSLSVSLLRELWSSSSRQPLPRTDVRAITSGNLDAIRAFLRGEQHYRASAWDSALVWFARAVAEDSVFPLAHYRLAMTASWGGEGLTASAGGASTSLALHYVERLPPREQLLVRVMALRANGESVMAMDTLRAYLRTYPDDAEAWFILADDTYHAQHESIAPLRSRPEEQLVLFDRVLSLDPSFTPALIHPLEIAFQSGDGRLIEQYTSLLSAVAPGNGAASLYLLAASALKTRDAVALGTTLARAVAAADSGSADLNWQAARASRTPLLSAVIALSPQQRALAVDAFRQTLGRTHRDAAAAALAHIDVATGAVDAARALLAPLAGDPLSGPAHVRQLDRLPVYAGVADSAAIGALLMEVEPVQLEALRLIAAIDRRDAHGAQQAAQAIGALAGDSTWLTVAEAGYAFAAALAGDTIAGLAQLQATLPRHGFAAGSLFDALWFRWVELLGEHPQTRARAIELLLGPWAGDPALDLQRQFVLGRALDDSGDPANARIAYTRFITAAGDPEQLAGRLQERARAARDALARLGSQRPSTTS